MSKDKPIRKPLKQAAYSWDCKRCKEELKQSPGWSWIDIAIWHHNGHVWPGYAGEPTGDNFGGSDF